MSTSILIDRVKILILSSGVGAFALGPGVTGFRGIEVLVNGGVYSYSVEVGGQYEVGQGTYLSAGPQFVRVPEISSNGGAAVPFPANCELVFTARAADLIATGGSVPIVNALGNDPNVAIAQQAATIAINGKAATADLVAFENAVAAAAGAELVGFINGQPGSVSRTVALKLQDLPTPQDFGVALEPTSQGLGVGVLRLVTTGVKNTGSGWHALQNLTKAQENTATGYRALSSVVGDGAGAGDFNSAFGSFALASVTTGAKNAAFGRASSDNLTTGSMNFSGGYGSMHWATTAQNCVALGFETMHGGVAGPVISVGSVGVGFRALYECLSGDYNFGGGTASLGNLTTGDRNTGVGTNSLNGMITGSDSVGVGYGAGLLNTGSGCTFLGAGADANPGLNNVTVIGQALTATASNTLLLGNAQTVIPGAAAADFGTQANPWNFGIFQNSMYALSNVAPVTGGANGKGFLFTNVTNFGVFPGLGAPTMSAAKGALYLRRDGSTTNDRAYINIDGGSTWTAILTAA